MECNRPSSGRVVASAGVCDAFSVLACRQIQGVGPEGHLKTRRAGRLHARFRSAGLQQACLQQGRSRQAGRRIRIRRPGFARAGAGAPAPQELDHRSDAGCRRPVDCRGQSGHSAIQVRGAHPDRWARERLPAAERRAQRGAYRARCRGRHQSGPVVAVARSCTRSHQEEQAGRAAGIRSGAAALCAPEVVAGIVRDRPRSVLADAGRAGAGCLFRPVHRLCGR